MVIAVATCFQAEGPAPYTGFGVDVFIAVRCPLRAKVRVSVDTGVRTSLYMAVTRPPAVGLQEIVVFVRSSAVSLICPGGAISIYVKAGVVLRGVDG